MPDRAAGVRPSGGMSPDRVDGTAAAAARGPLAFGIVILALFQLVLAAWWLALADGILLGPTTGLPGELLAQGVAGQASIGALGVLSLAAAVGLVARLRAAWVLAMLLTGIGLAGTLAGYAVGQPDDVLLLLEVTSAFYLNQPGVRATFGNPRVEAAP